MKCFSYQRRWHAPHATALLIAFVLPVCAALSQSLPQNSLATHDSSKWEKEIAGIEARDRTNSPPKGCILFVGSSSIRMWTNLAADFPKRAVVNHGFGGSQLADSVNLAERIIFPLEPRQVIIYAGGNDINAGKDPEIVYGDFIALVIKLRAHLPQAKIGYISSAPNPKRWEQVEKVSKLNQLVVDYCRRNQIEFINVFPLMLGRDGLPKPDIYLSDRLHMNAKGYAIWKKAIAPYLVKGLADAPR